jgi:hypothetical protein
MSKQFKKPSKYITFASGWMGLNQEGEISRIQCNANFKQNSKANKGEAYKLFVMPVDEDGEQLGEVVEVDSFVVFPSGVDKNAYPQAPDFRVFFGVE